MKEKQHSVPQNIMSVEFKIIGDMSMKQFAFIAIPACIGFIMFIAHVSNYITIPLTGIFLLLGVLIAFIPIDDRPLDEWITNFLITIKKPTQRIWMRESSTIPSVLDIPKSPTVSPSNKEIATFFYQNPFDTTIKNNASNVDSALELKENMLNANIDKINKLLTNEKIDTNSILSTSPSSPVSNNNSSPYISSVPRPSTPQNLVGSNNSDDGSVDEKREIEENHTNDKNPDANLQESMPYNNVNSDSNVVYDASKSDDVGNISTYPAEENVNHTYSSNVSSQSTIPQSNISDIKVDSDIIENNNSVSNDSVVNSSNNTINEQDSNSNQSSLGNTPSSRDSELSKIMERIKQLEMENSELKNEISAKKIPEDTLQSNIEKVKTRVSSQQGTFDQQALISKLPDFVKTPNVISGVIVNSDGTLISDAVVIIKDSNQKPIRAVKSNQLGQFYTRTALLNGRYNIEINAQGYKFNSVGIELTGSLVIPFIFIPVMQENNNL